MKWIQQKDSVFLKGCPYNSSIPLNVIVIYKCTNGELKNTNIFLNNGRHKMLIQRIYFDSPAPPNIRDINRLLYKSDAMRVFDAVPYYMLAPE